MIRYFLSNVKYVEKGSTQNLCDLTYNCIGVWVNSGLSVCTLDSQESSPLSDGQGEKAYSVVGSDDVPLSGVGALVGVNGATNKICVVHYIKGNPHTVVRLLNPRNVD